MESLLYYILKNPSDAIINQIESLLDTQDGFEMFISLLNKNNVVAYSYMKMKAKDWINNPIRQNSIFKYKNMFYNLIEISTNQNFTLLCDFFEILFYNYFYWPDFINFLVSYKYPEKSFKVLNSCFYKFRKLHKSDKLFSEIIYCIEKTKVIFEQYYFTQQKSEIVYDINLLNIFYSLTFQDIHIFFEENIDKFISTLCFLFKKKELQGTICEIYNLFIMKYSDLLDFTKILGSVLISIDSFDYNKYSVLLNIIKKRNTEACIKFEDALVNAIKLGSILSDKEKEEMNNLEYSTNILNNIDVERGILIDLLLNITRTNDICGNTTFIPKLLSNPLTEESEIFLYTALKFTNVEIMKKCQIIINNADSDNYLSFAAFRYLLTVKEYFSCDIKYIERGHISAYLCCEMYTKYLQKIYPLEIQILKDTTQDSNIDINIISRLMLFLNGNIEDQFSCHLLNRIIKVDVNYMSNDLYLFLVDFCKLYIRNINSQLAFQYIFDIFGILITKGKLDDKIQYEKDFIYLINIITTEEIFGMYNPAFYLLSLVILHGTNDYSSILRIVSQNAIWTSKELLLSVICLTISLYKKKHMSEEQVNYIIDYLSRGNKYFPLLLSDNTTCYLQDSDDIEEYFILKSINITSKEEYIKIYKNAIEYFTNNFITKKNARRVIRSFLKGSVIVNDMMYKNIIEKNMSNLCFNNVPYSIYINFEI